MYGYANVNDENDCFCEHDDDDKKPYNKWSYEAESNTNTSDNTIHSVPTIHVPKFKVLWNYAIIKPKIKILSKFTVNSL